MEMYAKRGQLGISEGFHILSSQLSPEALTIRVVCALQVFCIGEIRDLLISMRNTRNGF